LSSENGLGGNEEKAERGAKHPIPPQKQIICRKRVLIILLYHIPKDKSRQKARFDS
jgi:hypothetical protein